MHIDILRKWFSDVSTIGELRINGEFECYTLEDRQRATGVKVPGQTAIPGGTYPLVVDLSTRFKKYMPHVLNVPTFDGIRLHAGNTDADTHGCILLGKEHNQDYLLFSRFAFTQFFEKLASSTGIDDGGLTIFRTREDTNITIADDAEIDNRSQPSDKGQII